MSTGTIRSSSPSPSGWRGWGRVPFPLWSAVTLAVLTLGVFAPLLRAPAGDVWSKPGLDLTTQVVPWWRFGFGEISRGHFPLWNPHTYCGTPYFTNFNTGVLYPLHWLNLLLPLDRAINVIVIVCVWQAGWLTSLWVWRRGVGGIGSTLAGVIFMFSGSYFYHLYPGHESLLASMAWTPLVLLAVDELFKEAAATWMLIGMAAVAMQILASFAQAVYLTGLVTGIYVLLRLRHEPRKMRLLVMFAAVYVGGALLGAVQLFPGMATAHESVRAGGNSLEFASQYSLPPENLLTLVAPRLFGDMKHSPYFGRSFLWEASLYCSLGALVLAGCGVGYGDQRKRLHAGTLVIICLVLAMGAYIRPLYVVLYYCLPFFTSFRVAARFKWFVTLYLALLAGVGFDALAVQGRWRRPLKVALIAAGPVAILACVCALSARSGGQGMWGAFVHSRAAGPDQKNSLAIFDDPTLARRTGIFAARQLLWAAGVLAMIAAGCWSMGRWEKGRCLLVVISVAELVCFTRAMLVHGPMNIVHPSEWTARIEAKSPDERVLHPDLEFSNRAMMFGYDDVYGYDPLALKRYSDLLSLTQGWDPDRVYFAPQPTWLRYPAVFRMLRCRYVFTNVDPSVQMGSAIAPRAIELSNPLPHLLLVEHFEVKPTRAEIFAALSDPVFDPTKTVYLESDPGFGAPRETSQTPLGSVSLVRSSTDTMEISASLRRPAILLITDAYSSGWRATSLTGAFKAGYRVMPANYALRAVPLDAGEHHFVLAYAPVMFSVGKWTTLSTSMIWIVAMAVVLYQRRSTVAQDVNTTI